MPARVRKIRHDENTRDKIQVAQLINRLQAHVDGKAKMSPTQVRAAEILLRKKLPDLAAIEHSGEVATNNIVSPDPPTPEAWNERFVRPTAH